MSMTDSPFQYSLIERKIPEGTRELTSSTNGEEIGSQPDLIGYASPNWSQEQRSINYQFLDDLFDHSGPQAMVGTVGTDDHFLDAGLYLVSVGIILFSYDCDFCGRIQGSR